MSKHNETGLNGEQIAENFLKNKGYIILYRNWYAGKKEVDIIAKHKDILVFIEVKTRSNFDFGYPEEAVTEKKQAYLKAAADTFLEEFPEYTKLRFDIVSVQLEKGIAKEIVHFEDAFY